jgi:hypothetical protein
MLKALTLSACLLAPAAAQAFSQCIATPLTGSGGEIAQEGANPVSAGKWVYAGFMDGGKVGVAASSDSGKTLGQPVVLANGDGTAKSLRLAANGKDLYAAWHIKQGGATHLMFDVSHANGAAGSWDAPVDFGLVTRNLPQLVASGSYVHLAYIAADGNIAVVSSKNGGRKFLAPVLLGPGSLEVAAAGEGSHLYVTWEVQLSKKHDEVMMASSADDGASFTVQNLSHGRPDNAVEPILTVEESSGRASLVWRETGTIPTGYYLQSADGGRSWSAPLAVDGPARQFMVADDGRTIYVSYLKQVMIEGVPDYQVMVATSTDAGLSFPGKQNLTGMTGITKIIDDDFRPIPWVRRERAFRLTGIKADGVYLWGGRDGRISRATFLGPGYLAAPALDSSVWQSADGAVTYGVCN